MRDDFIVDMWSRIKHMIPPKDRLDVADAIIAACDEYGYTDGIELRVDLDKELLAAVTTHFAMENDDEDDEYDEY